jgi:hypothetical protein
LETNVIKNNPNLVRNKNMFSPNLDTQQRMNENGEEMDLDQYISAFGKDFAKKSARSKGRSNISGTSRSPD